MRWKVGDGRDVDRRYSSCVEEAREKRRLFLLIYDVFNFLLIGLFVEKSI